MKPAETGPGESRPREEIPHDTPFTAAHWLLLLVLAAVQFSHIIDYVLIMPLATHLEADLRISTSQFGRIVSAYGFAAALTGLLFAPWLDRFDRKRTLLVLYAGFALGTFVCAVAPNYLFLVLGRVIAGGFGGVVAAVVMAIVGDAFPLSRRGTATGVVMSAFSVASIVGVPLGLYFANGSSWRTPFYGLTALSAVLLLVAARVMPAQRGHLTHEARAPFLAVLLRPAHLRAYLFMTSLVFSTFSVIPYIAAFLVKNVGRTEQELPLVYIYGGLATLLTMNLIGRLADRMPRLTLFRILVVLAMIPTLLLPQLPHGASLALTLAATTAFMVLASGRMVPAMAMITSVAAPRMRGSFMSVNTAVQQLGSAMAALMGSLILGESRSNEPLVGYPTVSLVAAGAAVLCLALAGLLRPDPGEVKMSEAPPVPVSEVA